MLADLGLTEDALRCDAALRARHNCSGNHTGFLAAMRASRLGRGTYQSAQHPAQRAALTMFAAVSGLPVDQIATASTAAGSSPTRRR